MNGTVLMHHCPFIIEAVGSIVKAFNNTSNTEMIT